MLSLKLLLSIFILQVFGSSLGIIYVEKYISLKFKYFFLLERDNFFEKYRFKKIISMKIHFG